MNRRQASTAVLVLSALGRGNADAGDSQQTGVSPMQQERYKQNPVYLFFEAYILDAIGHLPPERARTIQSMNLQKVFKTNATEWRAVVREALHLSETIDIAILDLWYRNSDIAQTKGMQYPPEQFAVNFTDEYMKEGSRVDVWAPGALEAAKKRIATRRARAKSGG